MYSPSIFLVTVVACRACARIGEQQLPRDFTIDVAHELALFLHRSSDIKVNLTHSPAFCLAPGPDCATWIEPFHPCVSG